MKPCPAFHAFALSALLVAVSSCRTVRQAEVIEDQPLAGVHVMGEVNEPGVVPLPHEFYVSVAQVLELAGGFTLEADSQQILLERNDDGDEIERLLGFDSADAMRPGDRLTVLRAMPAHARIWVEGEVASEGVMYFKHTQRPPTLATLMQRGGFTSAADMQSIYVLRDIDGHEATIPVHGDRSFDLQDGDKVVVPAFRNERIDADQ